MIVATSTIAWVALVLAGAICVVSLTMLVMVVAWLKSQSKLRDELRSLRLTLDEIEVKWIVRS